MIQSRSPSQYDPHPYVDANGIRHSAKEAPAGAVERARSFFAPTDDETPIFDRETATKLSIEDALSLIETSDNASSRLIWFPSDFKLDHNPILASIRLSCRNRGVKALDVFKAWLVTLDEMSAELLIAVSPGLTTRKITEAKEVLQRLVIVSTETKGKVAHG